MNKQQQYFFLIDKEKYVKYEPHLTAIGFPLLNDDSITELSYENCMTLVMFKIADALQDEDAFQDAFNHNRASSGKFWLRIIDKLAIEMMLEKPIKPSYLYNEAKFPKKKVKENVMFCKTPIKKVVSTVAS